METLFFAEWQRNIRVTDYFYANFIPSHSEYRLSHKVRCCVNVPVTHKLPSVGIKTPPNNIGVDYRELGKNEVDRIHFLYSLNASNFFSSESLLYSKIMVGRKAVAKFSWSQKIYIWVRRTGKGVRFPTCIFWRHRAFVKSRFFAERELTNVHNWRFPNKTPKHSLLSKLSAFRNETQRKKTKLKPYEKLKKRTKSCFFTCGRQTLVGKDEDLLNVFPLLVG